MPPDERHFFRFRRTIAARCTGLDKAGRPQGEFTGLIHDVSGGGILLVRRDIASVGERFRVSFTLGRDSGVFEFTAEVVSVEQRAMRSGYSSHSEFIDVEPLAQRRLLKAIADEARSRRAPQTDRGPWSAVGGR